MVRSPNKLLPRATAQRGTERHNVGFHIILFVNLDLVSMYINPIM